MINFQLVFVLYRWFDKNGIIDDGSEELGEIIKEDVFPNAHNLYSDRVLILDDELGVVS